MVGNFYIDAETTRFATIGGKYFSEPFVKLLVFNRDNGFVVCLND